ATLSTGWMLDVNPGWERAPRSPPRSDPGLVCETPLGFLTGLRETKSPSRAEYLSLVTSAATLSTGWMLDVNPGWERAPGAPAFRPWAAERRPRKGRTQSRWD